MLPSDKKIRELLEDGGIMDILTECYDDTALACKILWPRAFYRPFGPVHEKLFEVLDDDSVKKVAIVAHRNMGKSTILKAFGAKRLLLKQNRFIVPIGATEPLALQHSDNLKMMITKSESVKKIWGNVKPKAREEPFSKHIWSVQLQEDVENSFVLPRSTGQAIRGLLIDIYRPDLILSDDLEKPDDVRSDTLREQARDWFHASVSYIPDMGDRNEYVPDDLPDWRMVVAGTLLSGDSLLADLMHDSEWTVVNMPLCDENFKSYWPAYKSDDSVLAEAAAARKNNRLDVFYRERMNILVGSESAIFKSEMFNEYKEESEENFSDKVESVIILDPAKTTNIASADSAIVGWGVAVESNRLYVRDVVRGKMHPEQIYSEVFAMAQRLGARVIGIEVTSLHEFITYPFLTEMHRRGLNYQVVELKARDSKETRIAALVPFYRQGLVYHNEGRCHVLEQQLLEFPHARLWDVMDAAAYIVELLEEGDRYFLPTNLSTKTEEDAYEALMKEDERPLEGWRIAL